MRKTAIYLLLSATLFWVASLATAQSPGQASMPLPVELAADTLETDSATADTAPAPAPVAVLPAQRPRIRAERTDLDNAVDFSCSDSMLIIRQDSAYMFGDAKVRYGDISLEAAEIRMDMDDNTVFACGIPDSTGQIEGRPVFSQDGTDYQALTMRYNFQTSKGYIQNVVTQQGEGYLTGGTTKKGPDNQFDICDGRYTTCDNHDHPHFYFNITRGRVNPGKNIVVGPTYMVLAGLPLPLAVPFGYFPFSSKYASGIIFPSFGDDYNRGFYLSNGGYYFAINDNIDLALTGEVYTKGSWGLQARSAYVRRYKFSGSFDLAYLKTITGEKGSPDYSTQTNFQILWSHQQDSKANPNMNLSASVNFTTSGYSRNDLNSYYSPAFTENTKSSSINMTYRFPRSKWSLSTTFNVSQRTQDSTLAVSFPNVTVNLQQVRPFKRRRPVGSERWYEKIKLSYTGLLQNSLTAKQNVFFKQNLIRDWRNGIKHNVPVSATFSLFQYLNVTPSLNFTDRMYTTRVDRSWDAERAIEQCDTTYGFYNVYDFQASVSMDTKVYGFFQPLGPLGKKVKMIRHVMTPSISFNAAPDFSSPFFGYYGNYSYVDSRGAQQVKKYSRFPNSLFGVPGQGKNGSIGFSLANNLEMKVRSDNDSVGERKISLIENLTLNESYNMAADSLRWSDLNTTVMLRLTRGFNLNLNAVWDLYTYGLTPSGTPVKINKLRIASGKGLGRLMRTGTSFSYTFNNDTFRRLRNRGNDNGSNGSNGSGDGNNDESGAEHDQRLNDRENDRQNGSPTQLGPDGYATWTVPWSLTLNYSVNYGYGAFNREKMEFDGKITQNLSLSGNIRPTPGWNFSFSASYNFDTHRLAYMNCNISRDLHCFSMRASFIPVGPYKSYNFHIAVKSSLLSDFKWDKRSSLSSGVDWY